MNVIAQLFGLVAYVFLFLSYQKSEKGGFLKTQIFANLFFIAQYLTLGAISAMASSSLSIARTLAYYNCEKKNERPSLKLLILFEGLIVLFGIITYDGIFSMIPIFICCLYAYSTWQENLKLTYFLGIIAAILWILYSYKIGAYVGMAGSFCELVSSVIGFLKLTKKSNNLVKCY